MKIKKESPQVQRARKKLEEEFNNQEKQINPDALNKMRRVIQQWINRHAPERVKLEDKTFSLFDENKHSEVAHNSYVIHKLAALRKQGNKSTTTSDLKKRISQA